MTEGIEINIDDFKRYNTREQNVVIFRNLLEVKKTLESYKLHQKKTLESYKLHQKIQYVLGSLIGSGVVFLFYIHIIAH